MARLSIPSFDLHRTTTDAAAIHPFAAVQVTDGMPGVIETVTVAVGSPQNGELEHLGGGSYDSLKGIFIDSGNAATLTKDLQGLVFQPTAHEVAPGQNVTTNFALIAEDNFGGVTQGATTTVVATAAEDAPVITGTQAGQATTDAAAIHPFSAVQVTDVDVGKLDTVTIVVSQPQNGELEHLGSGSYDSLKGIFTDSGNAATLTKDVQGLVFQPTAHEVAPGQNVTTNFALIAEDNFGGVTQDATTTVVATAAEDAPVITGTQAGQATTDAAAIHPFSAVQVTDVDVGKLDTVTIVVSQPQNGELEHLGSGSYDSLKGIFTDSGNAATLTKDVQGLVFQPTAHEVAPGQNVTTNFALIAEDNFGGVTQDATTTVVATAAEDAPVITGTQAGQATTDAAAIHPFSAVQVTDVDVGKLDTVTIVVSQPQNGELEHLGSGSYDSLKGIFTDSGNAATLTKDVQGLVFQPTAHEVAPGQSVTTSFALAAEDNFGGIAKAAPTTVVAEAVDQSLHVTGTIPSQTTMDAVAIHPFAAVQVTDGIPGVIETVTVAVGSPQNGELEHLGGGSYDSLKGIFTDSGSAAALTKDLQGLVFQPIAHEVAPGQNVTTGLSLGVTNDLGGVAQDATTTVVATAAEDAPVITGTQAGQATTDAAAIHPFSAVQVTDVDVGKLDTVTIVVSQPQNGELEHLGSGSYDSLKGIFTDSGDAATLTKDVQGLVFQPTAHEVAPGQSVTTNFALIAEDNFGGVTQDATTTVVATAAEDALMITGTIPGQTTTDAAAIHPFAAVQVTDGIPGVIETVTVAVGSPQNGELEHLGGGSYDSLKGIFTDSGNAATLTKDLQGLVFQPTAHEVAPGQNVTTNFALIAEDNFGGVTQGATTTVVATAAEDAPVITGTQAGQATTDAAAIHPFSAVQVTDVDVGKLDTVTIVVSQPQNGELEHLGSGSYDSLKGIFTDSGNAATLTKDVQGLVFQPTAHEVAPGQNVTTNFALIAEDNFGGVTQGATTTVVATAAEDAPVITGTQAGQATTDAAAIHPFSAVQVTDVDVGKLDTVTIVVSQPQNGELEHLGSGSYDSLKGIFTDSGNAATLTKDVQGLVFQPTAHEVAPGQSVTTSFALAAEDNFGGIAKAAPTTVVAEAVDQSLHVTGTIPSQTTMDAVAIHPFAAVQVTDGIPGVIETVQTTMDAVAIHPFAAVQVTDGIPGVIETVTVAVGSPQNGERRT